MFNLSCVMEFRRNVLILRREEKDLSAVTLVLGMHAEYFVDLTYHAPVDGASVESINQSYGGWLPFYGDKFRSLFMGGFDGV